MDLQIPESIISTPLTYKQLCQQLSLQPKTGKSKIYQIKNIELYCDLTITSHPTRYIINEIYDEALLPNSKAKFQAPLEILVMRLFRANKYNTIYITSSRLLECMKLVSDNYSIIKNTDLRNKLPFDTGALYSGASKSGEILKKWLMRALERMEANEYLKVRSGYCLVKKVVIDGCSFKTIYNVPIDSDLEREIMECQRQVYMKLNLQFTDKKRWIPADMKPQYYFMFDKEITQHFNGEYCGVYAVHVLTPNHFGIKETLTAFESEQQVNTEAQRKIANTKELNYLTGYDREKLIQEIITRPPSVSYKKILEEEKQKELAQVQVKI